MLGASELDAGLRVGSHKSGVKGQNHLPWPAGHASLDAAQDTVYFLGCMSTLLAHVELLLHQYPQVLLLRAALQPLSAQPVLVFGVALTNVQDPAFGLVVYTPLLQQVRFSAVINYDKPELFSKIFYLAILPSLAFGSNSHFLTHKSCVTLAYWLYRTLALSWQFLLDFYSLFLAWSSLLLVLSSTKFLKMLAELMYMSKEQWFPPFLPNLTVVVLAAWTLQILFFQVHCPLVQPRRSWEQPQSTRQKTDTIWTVKSIMHMWCIWGIFNRRNLCPLLGYIHGYTQSVLSLNHQSAWVHSKI